jgi:hypothetical protein
MAEQTSSTPPAVAMSNSLDAAQAEIAREMEAGVAAVLERAVGRLEQLAERLTRIDAQLTHVNGEADKLSACRRQSSSLRVQLQSAARGDAVHRQRYASRAAAPSVLAPERISPVYGLGH